MIRYALIRKADNYYYRKANHRPNGWTPYSEKAHLFTSPGHARNSQTTYVSYKECPDRKGRAQIRRERFDSQFIIVRVVINWME